MFLSYEPVQPSVLQHSSLLVQCVSQEEVEVVPGVALKDFAGPSFFSERIGLFRRESGD